MKKLTILVAAFAMLGTNAAFAQTSTNNNAGTTGKAAAAGKSSGSNAMAWGIAVGALAVVGTVVGVVAATAAGSTSSFSH